jgi:hypothetical protein
MRGHISRRGRGALFRGRNVVRGGDEGSGDIQSGSPRIEDGEVVPDLEEEEGHVEVLDSEEEDGQLEVPDSEEAEGHLVVPDSEEEKGHVEVPDSEDVAADDIPDAIARTLDAMEEQYCIVALSMYMICFSTFFRCRNTVHTHKNKNKNKFIEFILR